MVVFGVPMAGPGHGSSLTPSVCVYGRILRSLAPAPPCRAALAINRYKTMQLVAVLSYFLLSCVALGLVVFPAWRGKLRGVWTRGTALGRQVGGRWGRQAHRQQALWLGDAVSHARQAQAWGRQRWVWVVLTLGVLALPVAVVLLWGGWHTRTLEGFDDAPDAANAVVSGLLQGEHLVAPPPLPPEVFATADVEVVRPMLSSADRRWEQMDPEFVQRLLLAFKIMKEEHGYDMALLEGYRSPERQSILAAKGSSVTMAGAWQSYHQYGLAADCAFLRNGKLLISEKDPWAMRGYQLYGQVAERLGLVWGGRWQMMDLGHTEWRKSGVKAAMAARAR